MNARALVLSSTSTALGLAASAAAQESETSLGRFAALRRQVPFELPHVSGAPLGSAAFGDLDGDGDVDVWNGRDAWRNDGDGRFDRDPGLVAFAGGITGSPELADLDHDGDLDGLVLVVGNSSFAPELRVLRGLPPAGLAPAQRITLPATAGDLAVADFDGDGDLDVLVGVGCPGDAGCSSAPDLPRLYANDGAGLLALAPQQPVSPPLFVQGLAVGDLDLDGDVDALAAGGGALWRLENQAGVLVATPVASFGATAGVRLALGDLDGDLAPDLLVGRTTAPVLRFDNDGSAGFAPGLVPAHAPIAFAHLALGDVDGDGDLDALPGVSSGPSLENALWRNLGAGVLVAEDAGTRIVPEALADLDGDLDLDLWGGLSGGGRIALGDGAGRLRETTLGAAEPPSSARIAVGDFDGDGAPDFASARELVVHANDGGGAFARREALLPFVDVERPIAADLDGDGDPDLAGAWIEANGALRLAVARNQGAFGFDVAVSAPPLTSTSARLIAAGDLDADGDADLVLGSAQAYLLPNLGGAVFGAPVALPLPASSWPYSAGGVGDLDGDGDLDLAAVGTATRVLLAQGGGFVAGGTCAGAIGFSGEELDLALGDVDLDGDLDLALARAIQPSVWLNTGSGLGFAEQALVPIGWADAVDLADLDRDGDLDLVASIMTGSKTRLWENVGGAWVEAGSIDGHEPSVVALDVDRDGDVDLLSPGTTRFALANLGRQLSAVDLARPGRPLRFDLRGTPGGAWTLLASDVAASTPLPPFGTLWLGAPVRRVGAGTLDPRGKARVETLVPPDPLLVGTTRRWQAVIGTPLRLSSVEVTTVDGL